MLFKADKAASDARILLSTPSSVQNDLTPASPDYFDWKCALTLESYFIALLVTQQRLHREIHDSCLSRNLVPDPRTSWLNVAVGMTMIDIGWSPNNAHFSRDPSYQ
jgi:hypothetical protein